MRLGVRGLRRGGELVGVVGLVVVGAAASSMPAVELRLGSWAAGAPAPGSARCGELVAVGGGELVAVGGGELVAAGGAELAGLELLGRVTTIAIVMAAARTAPPIAARARRPRRGVACVP